MFFFLFLGPSVIVQKKPSCWKKALYFLCGLSEDYAEDRKTADEQKTHFREVISLQQDPRARRFLLINTIFVLAVCIFLLAYFSIPDGGPTSPTIELPYPPFIGEGKRPEI